MHVDHLEEVVDGTFTADELDTLTGLLRKLRDATNPCAAQASAPGGLERLSAAARRGGLHVTGMPLSTAVPEIGVDQHLVGEQVAVHARVARGRPRAGRREVVAPAVRDAHRRRAGWRR